MSALLEMGAPEETAGGRLWRCSPYFKSPQALWDLYHNTFSGGERLRLNLAHAMVKRPRLMLLDEPTASLDDNDQTLVKEMLQKMKTKHTSMIGIFHDLAFMEGVCDKIFNLSEGAFLC
jgi:alpha-D-ribose 1-methylphosphonate 5-triphosphate synthase subunit PhnL